MGHRWRGWLPLILIVGALIAVGVGASAGGITTGEMPEIASASPWAEFGSVTASPEPYPTPSAEPRRESESITFWLRNLIYGAIAMIVLYFVIKLIKWLLLNGADLHRGGRATAVPLMDRPEAEEVRAAVLAGLADLDEDGDPRRAVIACWLRLERVAQAVGTPRLASDSPSDLVARLLADHDVDSAALAELADAYRLARYSGHEITEDLRTTARRALYALKVRSRPGSSACS